MTDERVAVGQLSASLLRSLASLDETELEALAAALDERHAQLLRQAVPALPKGSSKLDMDALQPLLERWWNTCLKEPVKAELRKLTRAQD